MASETLVATTTPILDTGTTLFPNGALVHTSRVLTATAVGEISGGKISGHAYLDTVTIEYSTDAGANWTLWKSYVGGNGVLGVTAVLDPIYLSVSVAMASIEVRVTAIYQFPDSFFELNTIQIVGDNGALAGSAPLCDGSFFGF